MPTKLQSCHRKCQVIIEGRRSGTVTNDPPYNLMTVADHEQALLDANQTAEQAIEAQRLFPNRKVLQWLLGIPVHII